MNIRGEITPRKLINKLLKLPLNADVECRDMTHPWADQEEIDVVYLRDVDVLKNSLQIQIMDNNRGKGIFTVKEFIIWLLDTNELDKPFKFVKLTRSYYSAISYDPYWLTRIIDNGDGLVVFEFKK